MKKPYKGSVWLIIAVVILVIIVVGEVGFYYSTHNASQNKPSAVICPTDTKGCPDGSTVTRTAANCEFAACPEVKASAESMAKDKYGLFDASLLGKDSKEISSYADDGTVKLGPYTGYNRIVASVSEMMFEEVYVFATKDYKTFILDDNNKESFNGDANVLNKTKISATASIPTDFPEKIDLGNFVLSKSEIVTYDNVYGMEETSVEYPDLKFFILSNKSQLIPGQTNYYKGPAMLEVEDNFGLKYYYDLMSKEVMDDKDKNRNSLEDYYINSDFTENNDFLYKSYGEVNSGCGTAIGRVSENISDNDLVKITQTKNGVILYAPKDINHTLIKNSFKDKDFYETPAPSYEEYASKNPVLIFKDPFNRYVAIAETVYRAEGGCAKPVVYLYPKKDTKVTLKFIDPINVTTSIPVYKNQWSVLAKPNGQLTDLQTSLTDCNKIDYTKHGSEYAKIACETNSYPYLYWAGQASGAYPEQNQGWIVESKNVEKFMSDKLSEIGLSQQEKKDMMEYWVPEILSKNTPYYKMSFIQTQQMNSFIPMEVVPTPNSVLRVFLDWKPLSEKPLQEMVPQKLAHFDRQGFALVEWGGLKIKK